MGKVLEVTMEDVARAAGVTQATVSMALRRHPKISIRTQEHVAAIAGRLGYQTNGAISTMMARIRQRRPVSYQATLGALIPRTGRRDFKENATFARYIDGAARRATELGFKLEQFWPLEEDMTPARMTGILAARGVEGLIVLPLESPGGLQMDLGSFAIAAIGYTLEGIGVHRAVTGHYEAMKSTLQQVELAGYRHIGLVADCNLNNRIERKWLGAFLAYAPTVDGNSPVPPLLTGHDRGPAEFVAWFERHRPEAIIAGNVPILEWLATARLPRSRRPGVVMLGERYQDATLATIDEHSERVGAAAIEIVVAQLHRNERGLPAFPQDIHVAGEWRPGPSLPVLKRPTKVKRLRRKA